jgi:hypothetical protein
LPGASPTKPTVVVPDLDLYLVYQFPDRGLNRVGLLACDVGDLSLAFAAPRTVGAARTDHFVRIADFLPRLDRLASNFSFNGLLRRLVACTIGEVGWQPFRVPWKEAKAFSFGNGRYSNS